MKLRVSPIAIIAWTILGFMVLPIFVVVPLSFSSVRFFSFPPPGWSLQWYANLLGSAEWRAAILMSLMIGVASTAISLVLGTLAAIGLVRHSFPGKPILYAIVLSPLMVPSIIIAIALYFWFVPLGLVGSPIAIIIAHVLLGTPYVVVTVAAGLKRVDRALERAALSLGASRLQAFLLITLPIIKPAFLSATGLAFLASIDELVIALFLGGTRTRTLQIQMWQGIRFESDPTVAALSSILALLTLVAFWATNANRRTR